MNSLEYFCPNIGFYEFPADVSRECLIEAMENHVHPGARSVAAKQLMSTATCLPDFLSYFTKICRDPAPSVQRYHMSGLSMYLNPVYRWVKSDSVVRLYYKQLWDMPYSQEHVRERMLYLLRDSI